MRCQDQHLYFFVLDHLDTPLDFFVRSWGFTSTHTTFNILNVALSRAGARVGLGRGTAAPTIYFYTKEGECLRGRAHGVAVSTTSKDRALRYSQLELQLKDHHTTTRLLLCLVMHLHLHTMQGRFSWAQRSKQDHSSLSTEVERVNTARTLAWSSAEWSYFASL